MKILASALDRLGVALVYLAAFAAVLLTGFVCLSAGMRYLLGSPFHFTEELVALLFLASVFLTLPYAASRSEHIRVTLFVGRIRGRGHLLVAAVNLLVILAFATWFTVEAYEFTAFAVEIGAISEQSSITLWPWMALLPGAMGLVGLIALVHLLRLALDGNAALADPAGRGDEAAAP